MRRALALAPGLLAGLALTPGDDLHERMDAIVRSAAERARGVVAVVEIGGEEVLAVGHGRLHFGGNAPATPRSLVPAGPLSDLWCALSALRLVEDGTLDLGAAVDLPGFQLDDGSITVRQLLTHTSGLPSPAELPADAGDFGFLVRAGLLHDPDTCQTFSSGDTWALAALIERATGVDFAQALERTVLEPAGLRATGWRAEAEAWTDEPGYWVECAGELQHDPNGGLRHGSARMVTTPTELARLLRAIASGDVLGDLALARMTGEHRLRDGTPLAYSFGWNRTRLDELEAFSFGAASGHEHVHAAWYPALDAIVVLASDADSHDLPTVERRLVREAFDLVGPTEEVRQLPGCTSRLYTGVYQIGCTRLEVTATPGGLRLSGTDRPTLDLHYIGGHQFAAEDRGESRVLFQVEEGERARGLVLVTDGVHVNAVRFGDG